jgi:hypothetical protein
MTSRNDAVDRILTRVRSVLVDLGGVLETGCWPGIAGAWAAAGNHDRALLAAVSAAATRPSWWVR